MTVLLDTSVLIDHLRGDIRATQLLQRRVLAGDRLCASTVVRTEILAGLRRGEEEATHRLLDALAWLDVTVEVADIAGEMAHRYHKSHSGVDLADYLVAATARALNAELLTQNVKHFPMFVGLRPAYT